MELVQTIREQWEKAQLTQHEIRNLSHREKMQRLCDRRKKIFEQYRFKGDVMPELRAIITEMHDAYDAIDYPDDRDEILTETHEYYKTRLHLIVPETDEEKEYKKLAIDHLYIFIGGMLESEHIAMTIRELENFENGIYMTFEDPLYKNFTEKDKAFLINLLTDGLYDKKPKKTKSCRRRS